MKIGYYYETIEGEREKFVFPFMSSDYKPKKSNRIIINLVERIISYMKPIETTVKYHKKIENNSEERIIKAEIKSEDGNLYGTIEYAPPSSFLGLFLTSRNARIRADFKFNSNNPKDKERYSGLVKIINCI